MMRWLLYLFASVLATVLTWLLAPVLVLFAEERYGNTDNGNHAGTEPRLPWYLADFGTSDNSLLGDAGHKARWHGQSVYCQMVAWLWRNPAYVFEHDALGATLCPGTRVATMGDTTIRNRDHARAGSYHCQIGPWWNYKSITRLSESRCLMIETGWKLQPYAALKRIDHATRAQFVCSIRLTAFHRK